MLPLNRSPSSFMQTLTKASRLLVTIHDKEVVVLFKACSIYFGLWIVCIGIILI